MRSIVMGRPKFLDDKVAVNAKLIRLRDLRATYLAMAVRYTRQADAKLQEIAMLKQVAQENGIEIDDRS